MDFNKLLNVSAQLGKMLLESGAEIYRVEESIQRMGLAYGAKDVDVYAVPTTIIITILTMTASISGTTTYVPISVFL